MSWTVERLPRTSEASDGASIIGFVTSTELQPQVGPLLRGWRQRRKLSQLALAIMADTSARHISFIETGRARPSRTLLVRLTDRLDVPPQQRGALLVAAGFAPEYEDTAMDPMQSEIVKQAVERLFAAHEPFPAVAINADEEIVTLNRGAELLLQDVSPELLRPPINVMRVALHPDGMARHIVNLAEWRGTLLSRLYRQVVHSGRESLRALCDEVSNYPGPEPEDGPKLADGVVAHLHMRSMGTELRMFGTITTFGATTDRSVANLSLETFHPADVHTADVLRRELQAG